MKPFSEIETNLIKQLQTTYANLETDDLTKDLANELKELDEEIQSVTIEQPDETDEEIRIEFQLRNADYIWIYLERDEDEDCWEVIA